MLEKWSQSLFFSIEDTLKTLAETLSAEQFEALHLFCIGKDTTEYISRIEYDTEKNLKYIELFKKDTQKTDLLILSANTSPIDSTAYREYENSYARIFVAWRGDGITGKALLSDVFEHRYGTEEFPPVLKPVIEEMNRKLKRQIYAYFGE